MNVLIVGSKGNLGQELVRVFTDAGWVVRALDRDALDVTNEFAIRAAIKPGAFDAVVNAAAWNDVDGCENPANQPAAWALNATAPGLLARAAVDAGAAFVHYSTDYVFDGLKKEGYVEEDEPHPISAYGESKFAGEKAVLAAGGRSYVCRSSKLFGPPGSSERSKPSFMSIMCKLAKTKPELSIVDEEVGSPTYTRDAAAATLSLLTGSFPPGVYHLINEGPGVTWYGFAEEFLGILGVATPRKPVPSSLFPKPAKRPPFARLRNTKFPPLRSRVEALQAYFAEYPESR